MCLSPISIKNPYYGHNKSAIYKKQAFLHDCESVYIRIPCGVCKECIALKQMYLVQRVQMEATNAFLYFSTLTYNNDFLPVYTCSNGHTIPFADILHLQNMFKRLRNNNAFGRPFRYLAVSERGKVGSRPHFHILWFLPRYEREDYIDGIGLQSRLYEQILSNWAVNLGSKRSPHYEPLCTFKQKWRNGRLFTNYDTHFVTPSLTSDGISSVAFYVCKYMLKQNDKERRLQQALRLNLSPEEYETVFPIVKSKSLRSEHFGLQVTDTSSSLQIVQHLRKGIRLSKGVSKFPCFFSPDSQATFPLAPYYKQQGHIYTLKDHLDFKMDDDTIFLEYNKTLEQAFHAERSLQAMQSLVDSKDLSIEFNFLDD